MGIKARTSVYGIAKMAGPFATVYACPCCKHTISFRRSRPVEKVGRGYGLRTGGAAFSKMVAHVRSEHPEQPR
jgi:hypothetical protein